MEEDILIWRWEGSGNYSSKSVYEALISRGKVKWSCTHTWTLPIPPTVRLFTFLMVKGKILTHDVLERRRIACVPGCVLCTACHFETAVHFLFLCPYAVATWHECFRLKGVKFMVSGHTVQEIWRASWRFVKHEGQMTYKEWGTWFMVVCWHIWMERNSRIFRGTKLQAKELSVRIMQYAYLWLRYCGVQQRLDIVVHCRSVDAQGVG